MCIGPCKISASDQERSKMVRYSATSEVCFGGTFFRFASDR